MPSKQVPAGKPDIVKMISQVVTNLDNLLNWQFDEMISPEGPGCWFLLFSAFRAQDYVEFSDIIRYIKLYLPGFSNVTDYCKQLLDTASVIDKKLETKEEPLRSDVRFLRAGMQHLSEDFRFMVKELKKDRKENES